MASPPALGSNQPREAVALTASAPVDQAPAVWIDPSAPADRFPDTDSLEARGIIAPADTLWPRPVTEPPLDTYYDLPVVKAPPWQWYVPAYFYCGGLAGAASTLAGAFELTSAHFPLERQLRWITLLGEATGAALLIADLGRPSRFHHMLRVFRPTSPMNLGTWILSSASATTALGLLYTLRHRRAPAALSIAALATGCALSTYTGVLVGNTAIPLWAATRRRLPLWFAALSAASLGSLLELLAPAASAPDDVAAIASAARTARVTRIYAAVAKAAALATAASVARAASAASPDVAAPVRRGRSATVWRAALWLGVASLAATLAPGRSRPRSLAAGFLGTASTVLARFALAEAGRASAADPRATLVSQHHR